MRGVHPPILSQELFDAVQGVLTGRSETAQPRQVLNADFPPRQFIRCAKCASVGDATKEVGGHWNFNVQLQFPSNGARTHFIPRTPQALRMISNHRHGLALARLCTWKISTGTRLGMMVHTLPTRRPTSISTIQTARQREEATLGSGKVFQRAGTQAGIGKLRTHSVRHSYRSWLDAVGTAIAVQQKLMRHSFATHQAHLAQGLCYFSWLRARLTIWLAG